jgi:hypothetical protein
LLGHEHEHVHEHVNVHDFSAVVRKLEIQTPAR